MTDPAAAHWISTGSAPAVESTLAVALYDPTSGEIRHLHSVTVLEGAEQISEQRAVSNAKARAEKHGHAVDTLAAAVSTNPYHRLPVHRIDPKTGEFVALSPRGESPSA